MRRAIVLLPTLVLSPALASAAGVVGNGTPGSCTEAALNAELAGGGAVTLSCGGGPVTIPMTTTKTISAALATDVDGGGLVTLDGQDTTRLFSVDDQRQLALRNLTLRRGRAADVGVAVRSHYHERGTAALTVEDVRFKGSVCKQVGDDVGGGAIYVQGGVSTADGSTFLRNRGGNGGAMTTSPGRGGAIHSVMYQSPQALVVVDATFLENRATGGNGGAIDHQDGSFTFTGTPVAANATLRFDTAGSAASRATRARWP